MLECTDVQGLTVGVLIASAVVAGTTSSEGKPVERVDHSWEDILGGFLPEPISCRLCSWYPADTYVQRPKVR